MCERDRLCQPVYNAHHLLFNRTVVLDLFDSSAAGKNVALFQLTDTVGPSRIRSRARVRLTYLDSPYLEKNAAILTLVESSPCVARYQGSAKSLEGDHVEYQVYLRTDLEQRELEQGRLACGTVEIFRGRLFPLLIHVSEVYVR